MGRVFDRELRYMEQNDFEKYRLIFVCCFGGDIIELYFFIIVELDQLLFNDKLKDWIVYLW